MTFTDLSVFHSRPRHRYNDHDDHVSLPWLLQSPTKKNLKPLLHLFTHIVVMLNIKNMIHITVSMWFKIHLIFSIRICTKDISHVSTYNNLTKQWSDLDILYQFFFISTTFLLQNLIVAANVDLISMIVILKEKSSLSHVLNSIL